MAKTAKYTETLPVQLTPEWKARIKAVSDHPRIADGLAQVVRDCIELALPGFELELGLVELDDMDDAQIEALGITRPAPAPEPQREDRAKGSFGWTPPEWTESQARAAAGL